MAWLQIEWQLTIEKPNEYEDEPGLRFALVGINDGMVQSHGHPTGQLSRVGATTPTGDRDVWAGEVRHGFFVPTEENPYFAFAVQAYEHAGSSPADRRRDDRAFADSLELVCQEVVDSGGVPHSGVLWAAANAPRLVVGTDGVDDWIGAAAWVDTDYGRRIASQLEIEDRYVPGEVISPGNGLSRKVVRFPYGDAVYHLEWERRLVAGPIDEHSPLSMHAWSNASWVR